MWRFPDAAVQASSLSHCRLRRSRWFGGASPRIGRLFVFAGALASCLVMTTAEAGAVETSSTPSEQELAAAQLDPRQVIDQSDFHGGLIVQVGCQEANLLNSLAEQPGALIQGLVRDGETLDRVRKQIRRAGHYGRVSAMAWDGRFLPYNDGMINILILTDDTANVPQEEIERVLAPLGTAWSPRHGRFTTYRKPWPEDVDQWSHSRYDASGNAVSRDQRAGPPRYLQWEAWPRWNRSVKTSALVSTRGRLFYILDDSHFAARQRTWSLIARDAANGLRLWRHELESWGGARGGKKVGPAQMHRRLVASKDRVYATLAEFAPVSVIDAATGEILRTLEATDPAAEMILVDGVLVVMVDPNTPEKVRRGQKEAMRIAALDPESGKLLWEHRTPRIMPMTLASDGQQVVYHDGRMIHSLELTSGQSRWTSPPTGQKVESRTSANPDQPGAEKSTIVLAPQFAPTLIIYEGVVAFAGGCRLNVFSADDGSELWQTQYVASNYSVPADLFGFDGYLWGPDPTMNFWRPLDDNVDFNAYDPKTGEIVKRVEGDYGFRFQHHRCHQMKVVDGQVVSARAGIEFLDTETGKLDANHWLRGSCYYGILPANGRLYVPPHDCACYIRAKLSGFNALNARSPSRRLPVPADRRLQKGPAYGKQAEASAAADPEDWPTYRHDAARSGRTKTKVDSTLLLGWTSNLGGKLTSPVVAGGRVYLASTDAHTLYALDAATGEALWHATFNARIDSPPTIDRGMVLCGCRDGSVTALRATDGARAWRFVACPEERLIVSRGQLESVWPVHGSILVVGDTAYFAAGKSSYLDGGIRLFGLDVRTGEPRVEKTISYRHDDGSQTLDDQGVDGCLADILSSDGQNIFMRHKAFDLAGNMNSQRLTHLHSPDGFLSGETTLRLVWTYAPLFTSPHQGAFYDVRLSRVLFPSGRILVEGEEAIFGYGQNHYEQKIADPGGRWALFAAEKESDIELDLTAKEYRRLALGGKQLIQFKWWKEIPIHVRAIVKTPELLFVAGPPGRQYTTQEALDGHATASLLAISPEDGAVVEEMLLPATPVWDGMVASRGNLYLTLANGQTVCLWEAASGKPGKPLSAAAWQAVLPPVETHEEPGLVGHWRFDEGMGMIARDCSGRAHDAKVSVPWAKGSFGSCLVADGVPGAVVIPDAPHLQFGTDSFTLAWWLKINKYGARLIGKESFPDNWWVINLLDDGRAELVLGEGRGANRSIRPKTESSLATDAWNHLVAVADREAGEVRWYLNGKPSGRVPIPEAMTEGIRAAGSDIKIPSTHEPFHGLIGDLRIYRKAISPEGVGALYRDEVKQYNSVEYETSSGLEFGNTPAAK